MGLRHESVTAHEHVANTRKSMTQGLIKGAAVRQMFIWLEEELGQARVMEIVDELDHDDLLNTDLPAFGVLSSRWYDADLMHALCSSITRGLDREAARDLAYRGAQQALSVTFGGVQRALMKRIASPALHQLLCNRLWRFHFDSGTVSVDLPEPKTSVVSYIGWATHNSFICDFCTASDVIIYGAMGLEDVAVSQLRCIDEGAADCAHLITWA
jgi:hypothetical protein